MTIDTKKQKPLVQYKSYAQCGESAKFKTLCAKLLYCGLIVKHPVTRTEYNAIL